MLTPGPVPALPINGLEFSSGHSNTEMNMRIPVERPLADCMSKIDGDKDKPYPCLLMMITYNEKILMVMIAMITMILAL